MQKKKDRIIIIIRKWGGKRSRNRLRIKDNKRNWN